MKTQRGAELWEDIQAQTRAMRNPQLTNEEVAERIKQQDESIAELVKVTRA